MTRAERKRLRQKTLQGTECASPVVPAKGAVARPPVQQPPPIPPIVVNVQSSGGDKRDEPDNSTLAEHCRLTHFTLVSLCIAMWIALTANPDKRLNDTLRELDQIRTIKAHWRSLPDRIDSVVADIQRDAMQSEILGSVMADGVPYDVIVRLNLRPTWVPRRADLYTRDKPNMHAMRIRDCGTTVTEFRDVWDWNSQLQLIFVPTEPMPLLSVGTLQIGNKTLTCNQTVKATVKKVEKPSTDRLPGTNERVFLVELGADTPGELIFGPFPTSSSGLPKMSRMTEIGTLDPPLAELVTRQMHLDGACRRVTLLSRTNGQLVDLPQGAVSLQVKLPLAGVITNVTPLANVLAASGLPSVPGESFSIRFPNVERLANAYKQLKVDECVDVLTEQRGSLKEQTLNIAGLEIPLEIVVRWGQLLVLAIYSYFLVHLFELTRRLRTTPEDKGWKAPWVALYGGWSSRTVTFLTAVVLPVVVAILSFERAAPTNASNERRLAMYLSGAVILFALLAAKMLHSLMQARSRTQGRN